MGTFDQKLIGEKKLRGVKRKFQANESALGEERKQSLAILSKLGDPGTKKARSDGGNGVLNIRKAVRQIAPNKASQSFDRERKRGKPPARKSTTGYKQNKQ